MTITKAVYNMNKNNHPQTKTDKKPGIKRKWRELEDLRDRYALMRELQEDDYALELEIDDLRI